MNDSNPYCAALGIRVPCLETARESPDANHYALLIVALLERGGPITLEDAARRFEEAGVAPADEALASLKRCRPARPPIYRDGDFYALDPHDDEADLWAFRLGLRPPRALPLRVVRPDSGPLPSVDSPIAAGHLDEAWRDGVPSGWSAQRIAICVLDARGAVMEPASVLAFVSARSRWSRLSTDSATYWRAGAAVRVLEDGRWALDSLHPAVRSARQAVRDRINMLRRTSHLRTDPEVIAANQKRIDSEREAHAAVLARMRRVIIHTFPAEKPEAVVLLDLGRRAIATFLGGEIVEAARKLLDYAFLFAVNVRSLLRDLDLDPAERRLGELGPPQKSKQLNKRGRTLRITLELLVQGSCGISRPFGRPEVLREYVRRGELTKFRRRLEADAKSLFALYQYGCTHGAVRLRCGFLDEMIPAPWHHRDEPTLYHLMQRAHATGVPLEVVVGSAPGWADPWLRVQRAHVMREEGRWQSWLVDERGYRIDEADVQLARLVGKKDEKP
jgi:hypothetical protein